MKTVYLATLRYKGGSAMEPFHTLAQARAWKRRRLANRRANRVYRKRVTIVKEVTKTTRTVVR